MSNDTNNSLTDFDMCLALAQKAINSQMTAAWESWIARSEFSEAGEMKDFALVSIYDNEFKTSGLKVEFDPLTVSFYVENGKLGQVGVTLHLKSGVVFSEKTKFSRSERLEIDNDVEDMMAEAVTKGEISSAEQDDDAVFDKYYAIYKKQNPERFREETKIANWSISFVTDLDKKPCDRNLLQKIDPKANEEVAKCIEATKSPNGESLPESVFSIEYLFMKFTEVDLLLSDNKNIDIPKGVPQDVSIKVRSCLNTMLQGNNGEFMLGTVVRRSKTGSEGYPIPTFGLTDFAFHVKADEHIPEASTLSYLGMFLKRPLPQGKDLDSARTKLEDNWVRPDMLDGTKGLISGTMAISKERFVNQYLMERVANQLRRSPVRDSSNLKWTFSDSTQEEHSTSDIIDRKWKSGRQWNLEMAIIPGSNQLSITGSISSYAYMDGYTKKLGALGGYHTEWIRQKGHRNFSSKLTLSGGGTGSKFDLEPGLSEVKFESMYIDEDEIKGGANVLNEFGEVFKKLKFVGRTVSEKLENQQAELVEDLKTQLTTALNQINIDLSQHSFIPPGAGVFSFQNPRFSPAGDLLFDVIYKVP